MPFRNAIFTFEEFLTAVSKFPAFCGEKSTAGQAASFTDLQMCKKELAAFFAHVVQETGLDRPGAVVPIGSSSAGLSIFETWRQGLFYVNEFSCGGLTPP